MTPEQKQLDLIRGRVYVLKTATLHGPVPLQTTMDLVTDIDFLLSLVKEQEAEGDPDVIATARRIVEAHVHETRAAGHTDCDACLDADANAIAAIVAAIDATATAMRSACIEKVVAIPAKNIVRTTREEARGAASFKSDVLRELESLSIEKSVKGHANKPHTFDPIHNGADECECGLIKSATVHQ